MSRVFGPIRQNGYVVRDIEAALHHWTEVLDAELERLAPHGFEIGQAGGIGANGRFVYLDTEAHAGTVVEVSEISGAKGKLFERIAAEAAVWDGSDPIRRRG